MLLSVAPVALFYTARKRRFPLTLGEQLILYRCRRHLMWATKASNVVDIVRWKAVGWVPFLYILLV